MKRKRRKKISFFVFSGDAEVWTWGNGQQGRLGLGSEQNQALPTRVHFSHKNNSKNNYNNHTIKNIPNGSKNNDKNNINDGNGTKNHNGKPQKYENARLSCSIHRTVVVFWNEAEEEGQLMNKGDEENMAKKDGVIGESVAYGMGSGHLAPYEICVLDGDFVYHPSPPPSPLPFFPTFSSFFHIIDLS